MRRWLTWIAFEWALLASALYSAYAWPWCLPLAVLVIGSRQQALLVLGHEAVHQGDTLSDRVANWLCFWPAGVDVQAFRDFHVLHHMYIGTQRDPEVDERDGQPEAWIDLTPYKKRLILAGDVLGLGIPEALSIARRVGGQYTQERIGYLAGVVAAILWLAPALLMLWVWALFTVAWACLRARMWREHYDLPAGETHEYVARWWERALYVPHYIWRHRAHHDRWHISAWDL